MLCKMQLGMACACLSVDETVLEDLLLASAMAEGSANLKGVINLVGLDAFKEGCFAVGPALLWILLCRC